VPDEVWQLAVRRAGVIGPLAAAPSVGVGAVDAAAAELGASRRQVYLDNAAEFKSEALRRGCEQHAITLDYRPPGQPHYGGIVERVIGTMMAMVHELPGATFSNPAQRGAYDSDKQAALTLGELQRWLVLAVASYQGQVHGTTWQTPAARWAEGVATSGGPA
jgi:putative transposase